MMNIDQTLKNAASLFGLKVRTVRRDIEIAGSPERCELRFVIQDTNDFLYVIESIFEEDIEHKQKIIKTLDFLYQAGLYGVTPYMKGRNGERVVRFDNRSWQLTRYINGVSLDRPSYVFDKWRGEVLAGFLIDLREKSRAIPFFDRTAPFSLKQYIRTLLIQIGRYEPERLTDIQPVVEFLEKRFMNIHDRLPVAFCHGDYHPLNIIWGSDHIRAVIDWEFLGYKPELYDAANLIGCIGVEEPSSLSGELVLAFIRRLKQDKGISDFSWRYLVEFVIAMRFAWLSEWLRHKDTQMIELETVYMNLLVSRSDFLKQAWGC